MRGLFDGDVNKVLMVTSKLTNNDGRDHWVIPEFYKKKYCTRKYCEVQLRQKSEFFGKIRQNLQRNIKCWEKQIPEFHKKYYCSCLHNEIQRSLIKAGIQIFKYKNKIKY